jgi:general secretion pathway protein L
MADSLLLRLPRAQDQPATWLVVDPRGAPTGPPQGGPLSLAAARTSGRRICVLVPGTEVLLAEPEVPARAGVKLQQLVPYALEEQLADDVDDLHFALGRRPASSPRVPVAVVARSLMDEWLGQLKSHGIQPDVIAVDSELLPHDPGHSVALLEEDVVVVRPPSGVPLTLPIDALEAALESVKSPSDAGGDGVRGLILYAGAAEWHQHQAQIEPLRERFDGIKVQLLTGGPLALLAQQLPIASPINLLQGSYAPTTARGADWRAWRAAVMLLVCLAGLHLVGKAAELSLLKSREQKLDTSIRDTFRSAMQQESGPGSARRLMEQRLLAVRGSNSGLLAALEALVQARTTAPTSTLKSLNYHNGLIELKIAAPDAASLDRMSASLRSSGWQAELKESTHTAQGFEGNIQIRTSS